MLRTGGFPLAVALAIAGAPVTSARADAEEALDTPPPKVATTRGALPWAHRFSIDVVLGSASPSGSVGAAVRLAPAPWIELSLGAGIQFGYRYASPTTASPSLGGGLALRVVTRTLAFGLGPTLTWTAAHHERYLMRDGTHVSREMTEAWWTGLVAYFDVRYADHGHFRVFAGASRLAVSTTDVCRGDVQWCVTARAATPIRADVGIAFGASF